MSRHPPSGLMKQIDLYMKEQTMASIGNPENLLGVILTPPTSYMMCWHQIAEQTTYKRDQESTQDLSYSACGFSQ